MGRPFLGTRPFVVRLLPVEIGVVTLAAAKDAARSPQAWAVGVLWEAACAVVGKERAGVLRVGAPMTPEEAAAVASLVPTRPEAPRPFDGRPTEDVDRQLSIGGAGLAPPASIDRGGARRPAPKRGAPAALAAKRDSARRAAGRKSPAKRKGRPR